MAAKQKIKNAYQRAKRLRRISVAHELQSVQFARQYNQIRHDQLHIRRNHSTECAVVIHLYYTESWEYFTEKLALLDKVQFDLYISMPLSNKDFIPTIRSRYPNAIISIIPNRGRDVLPFLMQAKILYEKGYSYVLKIHSKKSTHRTDGQDWLRGMVDSLVPSDEKLLKSIQDTLRKTSTGVIGPEDQYIPLTVNFEANGIHMTQIVTKIFSKQVAHDVLQLKRAERGFFAGTMFWLRLDAIEEILTSKASLRLFESEKGQIDATRAHALERLFCIVPEIKGRDMYEIRQDSLKRLAYATDNVPDWSDVYIGPKSK